AIDADGSTFTYLIGYRTRRVDPFYGSTTLVDSLPDNEDYAVIATRPFQIDPGTKQYMAGVDKRTTAEKIHVRSGRRNVLIDAPKKGPGEFVTDIHGEIRLFSASGDSPLTTETYYLDPETSDVWNKIDIEGISGLTPVSVSSDNKSIYLQGLSSTSTDCLYQVSLDNFSPKQLACRDDVDLFRLAFSPDGTRPIRAYFQPGRFQSVNLSPDTGEGKLLEAIQQRFAPNLVIPAGWSSDGNRLVFQVAGDKVPGEFFLFDRKENQARFLLSARQWIDPNAMASRQPIEFDARDGLRIRGYLTLPPGRNPKRLPMVVLPHGGPIGIRDGWLWDADSQFLASRGYAVLQINFRGSGGYGADFVEAGRQQWGLGMIDDILDGTQWAIDQGTADPDRLCIYGASYGGYASLMSAVRKPDLFQCVVGYVGVYDLRTMAKNTDIVRSQFGRNFFEEFVGGSEEELERQSPMQLLDRLKAPMLIVHGKEDQRAPYSEAEALRDAMKEKGLKYEWMARAKEGHGFYKLENRIAFYEKLEAFLDKHTTTPDS
ncbi:S9 family peptidase, partial [uncultured Abyssibacter sp.]|uniref:S9 family peptidase n=1 Tax=uncultured Abyssibacter sp. TaxID=2320202 RepID=UPI0032B148A2